MIHSLYLSFFCFVFTYALFDNPCITNCRLENLNYLGVSGRVGAYSTQTKDCFEDVDDVESQVYSISSKSRCVVSNNFFYQIYNHHVITRCGLCLHIHGPSLKDVYCSIVGEFQTQPISVKHAYDAAYTIFVDDSLFEMSTGYYENKSLTFPMSVNLIDCPFNIYPAAVFTDITEIDSSDDDDEKSINKDDEVIEDNYLHNTSNTYLLQKDTKELNKQIEQIKEFKKSSQQIATFSLINTNLMISKIQYESINYYMNISTCQYQIPIGTSRLMKIYNLFGNSVIIPFNFTLQTRYPANAPLPHTLKSNSECDFRVPTTIIGDDYSTDDYFTWTIYSSDDYYLTEAEELNKTKAVFTIPPGKTKVISLIFPSPIITSKMFAYYSIELESSNEITLIDGKFKTLYGDDFSDSTDYECSKGFTSNSELFIDDDGNYIRTVNNSVKISACYGYSNVLMLEYYNSNSSSQKVSINSMYLTPINEITYYVCNLTKMSCQLDDECDVTDAVLEPEDGQVAKDYDDNCIPHCGECMRGFECNKAARCVKSPNYNTRSGVNPIKILLLVVVMLIL
ncbi:Uncharacterized protein QTN25_004952 [Entamoeba marina]